MQKMLFSELKQPGWVRLLNYKMFTFAGSTLNEHGFWNDFVLFKLQNYDWVIKLLKRTKTKLINMFNVKNKDLVVFSTLLCGPKNLPLRKNKSEQWGFYSTYFVRILSDQFNATSIVFV